MKKLQQLHDEIIKYINPKRVFTWAENINPNFQIDSLDDGFEISYQANFFLSGIKQNNDVIAHIVFFLALYDQYNAKPIFNTDVVNNNKIDLLIEIKLQEQANLIAANDGKWQVDSKKYNLVYEGFREVKNLNNFVEYHNKNL